MDEVFLWVVAFVSLLTFLKTLLDAFNKSHEAEVAHAVHYGKEVPRNVSGWSPKEKVDMGSIILGFLASVLGMAFAIARLSSDFQTVATITVLVAILAVLGGGAWASWFYMRSRFYKDA
jgi:hypothetical protein